MPLLTYEHMGDKSAHFFSSAHILKVILYSDSTEANFGLL